MESRFDPVPATATDESLLRAWLGDNRFLITGPPRWNALGLGSTAMFAATLVYNTQRTGEFTLDGRRFLLRRVFFPERQLGYSRDEAGAILGTTMAYFLDERFCH